MNNWQKLKALTFSDQCRLAGFMLLLLLIRIGLSVYGYKKVYSFISTHPYNPTNYPGSNQDALAVSRHIAYLVSVAGQHGLRQATCLHQTLLAFWVLRKMGIVTDVKIGIQNKRRNFLSHAWLVYDGEVVLDDPRVVQDFFVVVEKLKS